MHSGVVERTVPERCRTNPKMTPIYSSHSCGRSHDQQGEAEQVGRTGTVGHQSDDKEGLILLFLRHL